MMDKHPDNAATGQSDAKAGSALIGLKAMVQHMPSPAILAHMTNGRLQIAAVSPALLDEFRFHHIDDPWNDLPDPFIRAFDAFAGVFGKDKEREAARSRLRLQDMSVWDLEARLLDQNGHVLINIENMTRVTPKALAGDMGMEMLKALMEGADRHAIILLREDGRITGWNMSAERMSHAKGNEARGHYIDEFFNLAEVRKQRLIQILRDTRKNGIWKADRIVVQRHDGSKFVGNISFRPLDQLKHTLIRFAVVIEDLTEVLAREQEIRDSHARFRDFAESTSDWFWVMDRDLRVVEIFPDDPRLDPIRKIFLGKAPFQIAAMSDDAIGWWEHLTDLREHKSFRDFHYVVPLARGRKVHIAESGRPIFDENGRFAGYRGAARNVTAEIVSERDQRQREQRLIGAIDAAKNALLAFDKRQQLALWNGRSLNLMPEWIGGLQIGMTWSDFLQMVIDSARREDQPAYMTLMANLRDHDEQAPDGHSLHDEAFTHRMELSDGRWLEFDRYITEEGGIGLSVTDVTADETHNNRQRQAYKMEALGQLTGGVAHDFNNLLTVVRGNLEMLEMGIDSNVLPDSVDKVRKRLKAALEAADRGAALTQRLLGFARKQPTDPRNIDLDAHIPTLKELITQAVGLDHQVTVTTGKELGLVRMDPNQFDNAVLNLVINARDASPEGSPISVSIQKALPASSQRKLHAETDDLDLSRDHICVNVTDSGSGIPDAIRERIFDPFFTTKGPEKGSGLGLSMVYGFARQAGGMTTVKSSPGAGSTISIFLPCGSGVEVEQPKRRGMDIPDGQGETILLVEDHEGVQALMKSMFISLNYNVITADNGVRANKLISDGANFDLLFTDMSMPYGVSGIDVVRHMRRSHPGKPAIILTALADVIKEEDRNALAPLPILNKPVARADLARAVRDTLDAAKLAASG